jgi:hypothetical protein
MNARASVKRARGKEFLRLRAAFSVAEATIEFTYLAVPPATKAFGDGTTPFGSGFIQGTVGSRDSSRWRCTLPSRLSENVKALRAGREDTFGPEFFRPQLRPHLLI